MSYKIGLLLSMIFVALFFLFSADLISLQSAYSMLDAKANNISYIISRNGAIDTNFMYYIENTFNVEFICEPNPAPEFGEKIYYEITTTYRPLIIGKEEMTLSVKRMTIIGFYG